jgi:hypothetical protein
MAIRRGYSYVTVVVPTKLKKWVTRKARRNHMSRSRLLTYILERECTTDEGNRAHEAELQRTRTSGGT